MSILTELKKLTKKKNATVVSQALPDSLDGSESGSGGGDSSSSGVNMLTLYVNSINTGLNSPPPSKAYKNPECTEEYESYIEASDAIRNADIIQIVDVSLPEVYSAFMALNKGAAYMGEVSMVIVSINTTTAIAQVALWYSSPAGPV